MEIVARNRDWTAVTASLAYLHMLHSNVARKLRGCHSRVRVHQVHATGVHGAYSQLRFKPFRHVLSVLVFLQSRHKEIPKKHPINTVSTSHISHIHITFTRNAADYNITQSVLTRRHLSQSIVRAGKMLSITILPPLRKNQLNAKSLMSCGCLSLVR